MSTTATKLPIAVRDVSGGSRAARRLRRSGRVPGVLYGGEGEPLALDVDALQLRAALASAGAVFELTLDGESRTAVVKDGVMYVQAGAGIVADSNPESEHQECLNKARALVRAAEEAVRFARRTNR